ncbi:MAG: hypothetical protein KIG81_01930 [Thermoguttaceae bacterium]|nr:hypothetical protein [Thermoguttaceae bacterium]
MADKITTLHPENDTSINLYPNVKDENIPNTIARVSYVDERDNENDLAISAVRADLDTEIADRKKDTADTNGRIDGLATDISILEERITGLGNEVRGISEELTEETANRKKADTALKDNILDLYRMVIRSGGTITVTDASVALSSQPFPLTVSPKALLDFVGGMCQKVDNSIITAPVTKVVSKDANGSAVKEYPIPVEVQALDGYGWGINAECNNYIDFERKKFVKKVAKIDLGTLTWNYEVTYTNSFRASIPLLKVAPSEASAFMPNLLCPKYDVHPFSDFISGKNDPNFKALGQRYDTNTIAIADRDYANEIEFKQAMSGVYLYYELATPVETDISQYLDRDLPDNDVIDVSAGGYLEFENESNIGVPYSVTYQSKPETQKGE